MIVSGNKPLPIALLQNHAIVFIENVCNKRHAGIDQY